jgi:hypothetical protein
MAWQINGTYWVSCSCEVGCPCFWGELEGDDGWCSGAMAIQVDRGSVDGVDLSGTKVALDADWPKGFLSGEGKGRIYLDRSASAAQNEALEALVQGRKGGSLEAFSVLIPTFIASKDAAITIQRGEDKTNIRVGDMGDLAIAPIRNEGGAAATVRNAPAAMVEETVLGRGTGSRWQDPDLKRWESRGHAEQGDFNWSG